MEPVKLAKSSESLLKSSKTLEYFLKLDENSRRVITRYVNLKKIQSQFLTSVAYLS